MPLGELGSGAEGRRTDANAMIHSLVTLVFVQVDYGNLLIYWCNYIVEVLVLQVPTQCPARLGIPPPTRRTRLPSIALFVNYLYADSLRTPVKKCKYRPE